MMALPLIYHFVIDLKYLSITCAKKWNTFYWVALKSLWPWFTVRTATSLKVASRLVHACHVSLLSSIEQAALTTCPQKLGHLIPQTKNKNAMASLLFLLSSTIKSKMMIFDLLSQISNSIYVSRFLKDSCWVVGCRVDKHSIRYGRTTSDMIAWEF